MLLGMTPTTASSFYTNTSRPPASWEQDVVFMQMRLWSAYSSSLATSRKAWLGLWEQEALNGGEDRRRTGWRTKYAHPQSRHHKLCVRLKLPLTPLQQGATRVGKSVPWKHLDGYMCLFFRFMREHLCVCDCLMWVSAYAPTQTSISTSIIGSQFSASRAAGCVHVKEGCFCRSTVFWIARTQSWVTSCLYRYFAVCLQTSNSLNSDELPDISSCHTF